jgi:hypothetical protein
VWDLDGQTRATAQSFGQPLAHGLYHCEAMLDVDHDSPTVPAAMGLDVPCTLERRPLGAAAV